ncbi:MAG: tryptophan--tRNA ligase, partial [Pseudomonadota bacterium]
DLSRIVMTDDADTIAKKFKKAKSDADVLPSEEDGLKDRPEADNLVGIYAALADTTREAVLAEFGGQGFGAFKPALIDLAVGKLAPITSEMRRLMDDPGNIDAILADGSERARAIAAPVLEDVKAIVGFVGARG